MESEINIKNKRAGFEYSFLEHFIAGIQLTGTEIKSIRQGKASVTESFCVIEGGEIKVRNMQIEEYNKALELYPYKGNEQDLFKNAAEFLFKCSY